jgi:hypothetical protein
LHKKNFFIFVILNKERKPDLSIKVLIKNNIYNNWMKPTWKKKKKKNFLMMFDVCISIKKSWKWWKWWNDENNVMMKMMKMKKFMQLKTLSSQY